MVVFVTGSKDDVREDWSTAGGEEERVGRTRKKKKGRTG